MAYCRKLSHGMIFVRQLICRMILYTSSMNAVSQLLNFDAVVAYLIFLVSVQCKFMNDVIFLNACGEIKAQPFLCLVILHSRVWWCFKGKSWSSWCWSCVACWRWKHSMQLLELDLNFFKLYTFLIPCFGRCVDFVRDWALQQIMLLNIEL